ncbi:MAG: insulinase family protein [Bacteroidota bacterium]
MKKRVLILTLSIFCLTNIMGHAQTTTHGFKLIEKRFVKEVNADCYYYEHVKSGARLLKIASTDENKTFGIAFKTVPYSDNGIAHIMEHSVLNGSTKYPVKSPFDVLMKGSLKTFINAFTSKDYTMFPCASMNDKDYFNLMNVYMDAVFHPLIYTDPRILKQEGWHYELTDKDSPITYKGVVYNEMKGAYSSPTRELSYQIYKNLFPDNTYGYESGGYPSAIPTLTSQEFLDFHKKFYTPENSYIFLYGNGDMDKELEFLDAEYLSQYSKTGTRAKIADQKPFAAMKDLTCYYSIMDGADTKDQTYLSLDFVSGHNTEMELGMALDIICEVVFNQDNAPVRLALQKAGIGKDINAGTSNYNQNVITIMVQNANPEDKQKFYDIVMNTLKETIAKGIDMAEVQGVLNRMEFQMREGNDAQKGISYMQQIQPAWFFGDNPFAGLEYEKTLAKFKELLKSKYLEDVIKNSFLLNTHSLLISMEPKAGVDKEKNAKQEAQLQDYKTKLTSAEVDNLVKETNDLIAFQKREDKPEALATIPLLKLSDINPKAVWYGCEEKQAAGTKVLFHDEFTNNIVYTDMYFDLHVLPTELIPYASLLSNMLTSLDTRKYAYGDLNRELNTNTGGFYTNLDTYLENQDDNSMIAKFTITSKVMNGKLDKMYELAAEILNNTIFTDTARLKDVLVRHQSQIDGSVKRDGRGVATNRLASYFSNRGMFTELTSGLEYYWFVTRLVRNFDKNATEIVNNLKKTAALLFTKENLIVSTTCSKADIDNFTKSTTAFGKMLPSAKPVLNTWKFVLEKKNEGILTTSKVQYVLEGYDFKKLGFAWNGKMRVLNQIISREWLTNQIRVIGGAYGGYASISPNGIMMFASYRDPNLKTTLDNYNATPDYLSKFKVDDNAMTRFIIGTISGIDIPQTPQQKGDNAVTYYFQKRALADIQKDRDDILATKVADINAFEKMVKAVLAEKAICVYGNKDKINAEKDAFSKLIELDLAK